MKYAPKPIFDAKTALEKLKPARADYLEKREALEKEERILAELRETLAGHRAQVEAASREVEAAIRTARGKETEEIVDLQEMTIRKERQIRTVESMIAEQAPLVELRQIEAYGARVTYLERLNQARQAADYEALEEQANALFQSEAAAPFLKLIPSLMHRVESGVYNDVGYMATQGVDITTVKGGGEHVKPWLTMGANKEIAAKVSVEQMAAIGEIVARFMDTTEDGALHDQDEILQQIEPLSCEAQQGELGSGIATARRRKELLATLGEQAA